MGPVKALLFPESVILSLTLLHCLHLGVVLLLLGCILLNLLLHLSKLLCCWCRCLCTYRISVHLLSPEQSKQQSFSLECIAGRTW